MKVTKYYCDICQSELDVAGDCTSQDETPDFVLISGDLMVDINLDIEISSGGEDMPAHLCLDCIKTVIETGDYHGTIKTKIDPM